MTDDFTEADLYAEIEKYIAAGDDGEIEAGTTTGPEVQAQHNLSRTKAKHALDDMVAVGKLERDWINRFNGWQWTRVKGYRLVK